MTDAAKAAGWLADSAVPQGGHKAANDCPPWPQMTDAPGRDLPIFPSTYSSSTYSSSTYFFYAKTACAIRSAHAVAIMQMMQLFLTKTTSLEHTAHRHRTLLLDELVFGCEVFASAQGFEDVVDAGEGEIGVELLAVFAADVELLG